MPSRDEAKDQRRRRIVRAARELIQETEKAGFSMRSLAERADVSLVTPYNLFGSKQAIMYALLDEDIATYGDRLGRSRKDPLDLFFQAVSLGKTFFGSEPNYYRAVLFAVYNDGGREYRSMFRGPRRKLWRSLVVQAIDGGYLLPAVDADAFALNLALIYFAAILEWVAGDISLSEMEVRAHYGFGLALLAMCAPEYRNRLHAHVMKSQQRLGRYRAVPDEKVPDEKVPDEKVPDEKLPEEKLPHEKVRATKRVANQPA